MTRTRIQTQVFTTESPVLSFSGAIQDPQGDIGKHPIFMPVSGGAEIRSKSYKASEKSAETDPGIIKEQLLPGYQNRGTEPPK